MPNWNEAIKHKTANLNTWRERHTKVCADKRLLITPQQKLLNFVSNDYLGLAQAAHIRSAFITASIRYGIGSTGAPTLSGHSQEHAILATNLANWLNFEQALLFASGYQLNSGLYSQLATPNTTIWLDKNCHASHIDGILLSRSKFVTFNADSITETIDLLYSQTDRLHIFVTEGTFSMDGTCAYLSQIIQLKQQLQDRILLIIDDAHGIGALGINGRGTLEQQNLALNLVDIYIGTLGKALASHGGFLCGNKPLVEYLQQTIRSQLFSTALPPALMAAANASVNLMQSQEGIILRQKLSANISIFQQYAKNLNLPIHEPELNKSPIQLMVFNDQQQIHALQQQLLNANILVGKILYPTVSQNTPRLRISLNAAHDFTDIQYLCQSLAAVEVARNKQHA